MTYVVLYIGNKRHWLHVSHGWVWRRAIRDKLRKAIDSLAVTSVRSYYSPFMKSSSSTLMYIEEIAMPQNMKDAKIATLCKNKGEACVYKNYREIYLRNIT